MKEEDMFVERVGYNNKISLKLVMPTLCNCKCSFCYNKEYQVSNKEKERFLDNFINSIRYIISEVGSKNPITLDITGGEPTMDIDLFREVMKMLKYHHIPEKVLYITLTTNGMLLDEACKYMKDVVKYVNISTHHYDKSERRAIFGIKSEVITDYHPTNAVLRSIGITASTTAVIYKPIEDFHAFLMNYIAWAKSNGFIALRLRNDCFWKDSVFDSYMDMALSDTSNFTVITHENTPDSHWCRLRMKDGFRVFMLHGVEDTTSVSPGIEYVIGDDGEAYVDFNKAIRAENCGWEIGKIYDLKR